MVNDEEYDENLQHYEVHKDHENISEPKHYNESLEVGFEHTEQFQGNNKVEKDQLVDKDKRENYKCEFCNNPFDKLWTKKRHEKTHTKDKKLSNSKNCEFCKKFFKSHRDRERHERIHTGERPFKCNICQKRFSDKGALKGHENVHTGAKPFECKICGKYFVRNQTLRTHVVTQHAKDKGIPNIDVE